jgi:imidazolonepropionase-like amidohydrolase
MKLIQEHAPGISLETLLHWATWNGAKFLQLDANFGTLETGKQPGINLITNIDPETLLLTAETRVQKLC